MPDLTQPSLSQAKDVPPLVIALAGLGSLAVAMGIGRFAFTPLLPMMLADGALDLPAASWLASANYLGYLLGALLAVALPWLLSRFKTGRTPDAARLVRGGLVAVSLLTAAMALPWPATWPALRFAAGVASAIVFVFTSGWCLAELARRGQPALGGLIYAGPGLGIAVSGLSTSAMVADGWRAASGWLACALLAVVLIAVVWPVIRSRPVAASRVAAASKTNAGPVELVVFTLAYGLTGFGYIVTATFLPVIARAALPGSGWLDLFWPLLGAGSAVGALAATRIPSRYDFRLMLAGACLLQALGVILAVWWPTAAGFALGSLGVGLPFTVITFFGMQEARRLRPAQAASFMGVVTAVYGLGQIVGPPVVALLLQRTGSQARGFALSLEMAAAALLTSALLCVALVRLRPVRS